MGDEQQVRQLRDFIEGAEATRSAWFELCERVEAWEDLTELEEEILPVVNELLVAHDWEDLLRIVHPIWVDELLEGEHVPQTAIARTLDLRCQHLLPEDAELLAESPEIEWMTRLNLAYNGLQDEGTIALTESEFVRNLRFLDLSGNSVERDGVLALASCTHLTQLTHLDLTGNWVDDEAAAALAQSETLRGLETLVLRGNPIRKDGARALANSPYLAESIRARWADG